MIMAKTATISARIDPKLKEKAEEVFQKLGLTSSQAIVLFYKQVEIQNGLPFAVRIPNQDTIEALKQAKERIDLESYDTPKELFDDLGI
jgi:DNA-damage-inducible protein J